MDSSNEDSEGRIGFAEFILSMATNAIAHLGGVSDEERVPSASDVALAGQHIDILAMLKEKTAGNLDSSEVELLDSLLYDLRMRYVEVSKREGRADEGS